MGCFVASLLAMTGLGVTYEQAEASITLETLANILVAESPPTRIVVAESRGVLVGYAALTFDYSLWSGECYAHLDGLFVLETSRRQAIGKRLFHEMRRTARDAGASPRMADAGLE
ncbi:acetyltransferase (GNAT) family protein [Roseiarcus fermentans]|uniref:Acetyltransferase (GNAT) family protein n=2 Tax=Roseiarcus fermentans TaxID=1473586 RepID=A0A366FT62_9HYPH|nr:acetyltransferase (GNAT) family protein [Roseiarcus fermentans]